MNGFDSVEEAIKSSVELIRKHPLIPSDIKINGFIIDYITGELVEWTWADAVKLSWTYSDYIYLAEPTVSTLGIR